MFLDILNIALDLHKFLKIPKKPQNILNVQSNLEQKGKVSDIRLSNFNLYYKAVIINKYGIGIKRDTSINWRKWKARNKSLCQTGCLTWRRFESHATFWNWNVQRNSKDNRLPTAKSIFSNCWMLISLISGSSLKCITLKWTSLSFKKLVLQKY